MSLRTPLGVNRVAQEQTLEPTNSSQVQAPKMGTVCLGE